MKNIFKSLMFVAVAAMTFTACEKDNAENNNNNGAEQKTTITFNAKMADTDTRTHFGACDTLTKYYPTLLDNNEVAKFNSWTSDGGSKDANKEATINNGRFTVELLVNNGYIVDAYLPASAWGNVNVNYDSSFVVSRDYTFPMEQNPTTTSVDPKAHIFKATTTYNGEDNIDLYFEHQVAYGKMSLRNFAEDVVKQYVLTINGETYVVNATWTENVWFACEPAEVSEMSVSVVTANGTYTKPLAVSAENTLNFVKGQVSKFGVNMDGVTTGEAVDTFNPKYVMDNIAFDNALYTREGFKMTGASLPYPSNDFVSFYLNTADYTSTSIKTGTYIGNSNGSDNYYPEQGYFAGRLSLNWGSITKPRAFTSASTLDVSFADGVYTIILTHNGETYGYRGMPYGWTAPAGGGNEGGEEPEPVQLATPENVKCAVSGANVTITWDAVPNASSYNVTLGEQTQSVNAATATFENVAAGTYDVTVVAVGTGNYTNSEAANTTVTVEAAGEGGGEGGVVEITSITWTGQPKTVTFNSGTENELRLTLNWPGTYNPIGTYSLVAGESATSLQAHSITVGGNAVTTVSGTLTVEYQQYGQFLFIVTFNDVKIDGVSYTGSASKPY